LFAFTSLVFIAPLVALFQMLLKNITSNAKKMMEIPNANATMENMGQLFKKNMAKHDVKSALSGVMVSGVMVRPTHYTTKLNSHYFLYVKCQQL